MLLKRVFPATLALMAMSQPALAETVVVSCTITASDLTEPKVGEKLLFRIDADEDKWEVWSDDRGNWFHERCRSFGHTSTKPTCMLHDLKFQVSVTDIQDDPKYAKGVIIDEAEIDRRTGAYFEKHFIKVQGVPAETSYVKGTCAPAKEPTPIAPKTQF